MIVVVLLSQLFFAFTDGKPASLSGTQSVNIELNLLVDEALLFNHAAPLVVTLSSPYGEFEQTATGTPDAEQPERYLQSLDPVSWQLELPKDLTELAVNLSAYVPLCDTTIGLCYYEEFSLDGLIDLGSDTKLHSFVEQFSIPDFD